MKNKVNVLRFVLMLATIALTLASCGGSDGNAAGDGGNGGSTTTWLSGSYVTEETEGYGRIIFSGSTFRMTIRGSEFASGTYTMNGPVAAGTIATFKVTKIVDAIVAQYDIDDMYVGVTNEGTIMDANANTIRTKEGDWRKQQ